MRGGTQRGAAARRGASAGLELDVHVDAAVVRLEVQVAPARIRRGVRGRVERGVDRVVTLDACVALGDVEEVGREAGGVLRGPGGARRGSEG